MDKIINRARSAIGKGNIPDPKATLARKRIKAKADLKGLQLNEEMLQDRVNGLRDQAKAALAEGNEREYKLINSKFKSASGGLKMASAAVDAHRKIIDVMDSQQSMSSIIEMSKTVKETQAYLGIDPESMEDAVMDLRESMDMTSAMSDSMTSISDMVSGSDELLRGDPLKAELMAEIQAESEANGFGEQIRAEMKEIE